MPDIEILSGEASILPGVPDEFRAAVIEDLREDIAAIKARAEVNDHAGSRP